MAEWIFDPFFQINMALYSGTLNHNHQLEMQCVMVNLVDKTMILVWSNHYLIAQKYTLITLLSLFALRYLL